MEDSRIEDIITELRALRLEVTRLQTELQQRGTPPRAQAAEAPTLQSRHATHGFAIGDRVRILNKVKKPATWDNRVAWVEEEARKAIVTEVRPQQVFFTTDNGIDTWRAPNNLRKLP